MNIIKVKKKCAVCGNICDCTDLVSYTSFDGYYDGRESRSILMSTMDVCPNCYHVAFDIEMPVEVKVHRSAIDVNDEMAVINRGLEIAKDNNDKNTEIDFLKLLEWSKDSQGLPTDKGNLTRIAEYYDNLDSDENAVLVSVDFYRQAGLFTKAEELVKEGIAECEDAIKRLEEIDYFDKRRKESSRNYISQFKKAYECQLRMIVNRDMKAHRTSEEFE